ncbi:hypothetical protein Pan258_21980 [Symmachiella dynata]|nr:hypothetical protein Pan258_21980 [Symmachiella dynata]
MQKCGLRVWLVLAGFLLVGCGSNNEGVKMSEFNNDGVARVNIDGEEFEIVPSGMSQGRIEGVGLSMEGSEDMSHLLSIPEGLPDHPSDEDRDYRPDDATEWVLDVEFKGSLIHLLPRLDEVLSYDWMKTVGNPEIYGWSPEIEHWTFLRSGGGPKSFTKLAFSWQLFNSFDEDYRITSKELEAFAKAVIEQVQQLGVPTIRQNRSPAEAERLGIDISKAVADFDKSAIVVLRATENGFSGRDIWDVMQCLYLRWGDGDLFHWQNPSGVGDDAFFSIWTTTPPGYFFPEEIAAGRVKTHDLVFGYSIPRSADPVAILDSLFNAVQYAQERLGGIICDVEGKPIRKDAVRKYVEGVVDGLNKAGFEPGVDSTLHVF